MFLLVTVVLIALGFSIYHYTKKYETPATPIVPKPVKKVEEVVAKAEVVPVKKTRKPRAKKITSKKKKDV